MWGKTLTNFDATGHYVPQLADVVYERNKHVETNQHINLKGFIVSTLWNWSNFLLASDFCWKNVILEISLRPYMWVLFPRTCLWMIVYLWALLDLCLLSCSSLKRWQAILLSYNTFISSFIPFNLSILCIQYALPKQTVNDPITNANNILQVGNAETDDYYDYKGLVEFAWSHSVISDQLYKHVNNVCDFRLSPRSNECNHVMGYIYDQYDMIDIFNVYAPKCNTDDSSLFSTSYSTADMNAKVTVMLNN